MLYCQHMPTRATYYFTISFKGWSIKNGHFLTGQGAEIAGSGFKPSSEIQRQVLGFLGSYHTPSSLWLLVGAFCSFHFAQHRENTRAQQYRHREGTTKLSHLKEHFGWSAVKQLKGGDLPATMDSTSQFCRSQYHWPQVPQQAVPAPIAPSLPGLGVLVNQSAAPTRKFPDFLLLCFPISVVTNSIPSSCTGMENFCLLMRGIHFCLFLNLLYLTKVL